MDFSKLLLISYSVLLLLGGYLAFVFSSVKEPSQYSALVNLLGLALDFIGVVLLSDQFITVTKKFKTIHELVLSIVLGLPFMISIGAIFYTLPAFLIDLPISDLWKKAVGIVLVYVGITLYGFDSISDGIGFNFMSNIKIRTAYYGWFMLLSGLAFQIYASLIQLKNV